MKNYNIIIVAILALAVGLLVGKFAFNSNSSQAAESNMAMQDHSDMNAEGVWTCSMHPQIRQDEFGACPICGMDLIPAESSNSSVSTVGFQMTDDAIKLANIQTTIVGTSTNENNLELNLSGKIKADETKESSVVTHIPGRVEQLFVSFTGETIQMGQKIATMYSPEIIQVQNEIREARKIIDITPELYTAAVNKLKYWKLAPQTIDQILSSNEVLETIDIYAHHGGVVKNKRVSVGDHLQMGGILFDVQNLNTVWALFEVYESDLSKIRVGNQIRFTTPASPGKVYTAKISFIDPVINPQTRVATVRAELDNSNGKLKPEMFVNGLLRVYNSSKGVTIPQTAVLWTGKRSVVYVKVPNQDIPSFEYREVELGDSGNDGYTVLSGLENGEEVVTNGAFVIDAASQLNNQSSMMNKTVERKGMESGGVVADFTAETPAAFTEQLSKVVDNYLSLKNSFVNSDQIEAINNAEKVLTSLNNVDMALVKGEAHDFWMEQLTAMKFHATQTKDNADLKIQREQFVFFSDALISSLKAFGVGEETYYVQNCPMANDNLGANWISLEKEIKNPYYGDLMMNCGSVMETLN